MPNSKIVLSALALSLLLCACGTFEPLTINTPDETVWTIDATVYEDFAGFISDETGCLPLEQLLYAAGFRVIAMLEVQSAEETSIFLWSSVADSACIADDGTLLIEEERFPAATISAQEYPQWSEVNLSITDIIPTAASALGLPAPEAATGSPLVETEADQVLLLFLDGFGYVAFEEALELELIPNLASLPAAQPGFTTYPPITTVSSASLLTGTTPDRHGTELRGIRITDTETLLDVAAGAGLNVTAVEGEALAFNLRNAEIILSGDRDGNGGTDDNVLANALEVLSGGMPDLFYVHFHGIDDLGHTYGPGTEEVLAEIHAVDAAVGEILAEIPGQTLVIIFADHGMHAVDEAGRLGNHGHLIPEDMLIPIIWFLT